MWLAKMWVSTCDQVLLYRPSRIMQTSFCVWKVFFPKCSSCNHSMVKNAYECHGAYGSSLLTRGLQGQVSFALLCLWKILHYSWILLVQLQQPGRDSPGPGHVCSFVGGVLWERRTNWGWVHYGWGNNWTLLLSLPQRVLQMLMSYTRDSNFC